MSKGLEIFDDVLKEIKANGLYKNERVLLSPQGNGIDVADGKVLNFCANNYLGLANRPELVEAADCLKPCSPRKTQ